MKRMSGVRLLGIALLLSLAVLVACGGDDDDDDADATSEPTSEVTTEATEASTTEATSEPADTATAEATTDDDSEGDDGDSAGASAQCPLTAEEVSEALGETVEESSCTFYPPNGASPNAIFVRVGSAACSDEGREAMRFDQEYDGLDIEAYSSSEGRASLLVCTDAAFNVSVDIFDDEAAALAAADALARIVLEREQ